MKLKIFNKQKQKGIVSVLPDGCYFGPIIVLSVLSERALLIWPSRVVIESYLNCESQITGEQPVSSFTSLVEFFSQVKFRIEIQMS